MFVCFFFKANEEQEKALEQIKNKLKELRDSRVNKYKAAKSKLSKTQTDSESREESKVVSETPAAVESVPNNHTESHESQTRPTVDIDNDNKNIIPPENVQQQSQVSEELKKDQLNDVSPNVEEKNEQQQQQQEPPIPPASASSSSSPQPPTTEIQIDEQKEKTTSEETSSSKQIEELVVAQEPPASTNTVNEETKPNQEEAAEIKIDQPEAPKVESPVPPDVAGESVEESQVDAKSPSVGEQQVPTTSAPVEDEKPQEIPKSEDTIKPNKRLVGDESEQSIPHHHDHHPHETYHPNVHDHHHHHYHDHDHQGHDHDHHHHDHVDEEKFPTKSDEESTTKPAESVEPQTLATTSESPEPKLTPDEYDPFEIVPPTETVQDVPISVDESKTIPIESETEKQPTATTEWSPKIESPSPSTSTSGNTGGSREPDTNTSESTNKEQQIKLLSSSSSTSGGGQKYCADLNQLKQLFDQHIEPIYMPLIHLLPVDFQLMLKDETQFGGLTRASCLFVSFVLVAIMSVWYTLSRVNESRKISLSVHLNEQLLAAANTIKRLEFENKTFSNLVADLEGKQKTVRNKF